MTLIVAIMDKRSFFKMLPKSFLGLAESFLILSQVHGTGRDGQIFWLLLLKNARLFHSVYHMIMTSLIADAKANKRSVQKEISYKEYHVK